MAAVVGLIVLQIISIVPFVGAIASLFGFGAVLLLAWRTFRQPSAPRAGRPRRRRLSRWAPDHLDRHRHRIGAPHGRADRLSREARR